MSDTPAPAYSRRQFFAATSVAALSAGTASCVAVGAQSTAPVQQSAGGPFRYEVQRSEAEWRALLSNDEYDVLRGGETEQPKSSDLWDMYRNGSFHCKGCDLETYTSRWRANVDKGWVFFFHGEENAVLLGVDGPEPLYGRGAAVNSTLTETHCRRCGSHLGHLLIVEGRQLHCINGSALNFKQSA